MKSAKIADCSKCRQPIAAGDGLSFICFKVPGTEGYHYFHRRYRSGDCWEAYFRANKYVAGARKR